VHPRGESKKFNITKEESKGKKNYRGKKIQPQRHSSININPNKFYLGAHTQI
jgi:hypothetical protein